METAPQSVVLLIEDNDEISENMAEILGGLGYVCWRAANADEALRLLEAGSRAPSVILLDLRMPGMPPGQFVSLLRQKPAWAPVPVVLVTAALAADIPDDLDVDEVVFKPFQLDDLLDLVREVAARGRVPAERAGDGSH